MPFVMLILTILILIGFLVKPAVLSQTWSTTTGSSSNNDRKLGELFAAAQWDLCRQVNSYQSSNELWQRANWNCEQLMYKYEALGKDFHYHCQKPSLPAMCQKIDPKSRFGPHECTFEAEFVMNPSPSNTGIRFQAKMITCVNSIRNGRPAPGASIPVAYPPPGWNPSQPPHNISPGPRPQGSVAVPYPFTGFFPGVYHPFNSFSGFHHPPRPNPVSNYPSSPNLGSNYPPSSISGSNYPPSPNIGLNYPPSLMSGSSSSLLPNWVPSWLRGRFRRSKKSDKN